MTEIAMGLSRLPVLVCFQVIQQILFALQVQTANFTRKQYHALLDILDPLAHFMLIKEVIDSS